jgi:hypothetical protein
VIQANVRHRLTRSDAQLALKLVGRATRSAADDAEARLRDEGIDGLLDDPQLLEGLLRTPHGALASLPLFFYVLVRHALRAHGTDDRVLADYVTAVLLEFGVRDRASKIADHDDQQYDTLAQMLEDAEGSDPRRAFLVRVHLGNYALWVAGLFPDRVEARRVRRGGPDLDYYDEMGRRGFLLAADHRLANEHGLAPLYAEAARRYLALRVGLNAVSDTVFFPNRHSTDRLLRQVRDESRWRLAS